MTESFGDVSRKRLCIVWLMVAILLPVIEAEISEEKTSVQEVFEQGEVGTAISFKKDVDEIIFDSKAHMRSRLRRHRRSLVAPEDSIKGEEKVGGGARLLKYVNGCREDSNAISAIVECSNAVRSDPDAFAKEYPCDYQSWRGEVNGKGLGRLSTGPVIQRLAQLHTDDQARMNSMSHTGSDGSDLQTRANRVSLPWGAVGENVAVGFTSAKAVVMAWMCSPPHRKNLMSCDFSKIGVGTGVSQQGRHYYTQVFSCDLSETCGCNAAKKPRATKQPNKVKHKAPSRPSKRSQPITVTHAPPPPPRRSTHGHSSSSASAYSHGGSVSSSASAHAGSNHCAWINSVWTCGSNVQAQQRDPYGILSGRT